ncbi:YitT family protein [Mesobacillus maritimus]|uniref:YitT family protein n=1 Tax=Mesobacillus maritimus TaxID=1643336 RepID=UPI00203E52DB|nr:YitT family protein [Mesobacillus maritimus]MCM3585945.1 YitT family protein [Mesobacillus maritimus]MCM3670394.1 YitT family protein [Mesobacillus maritimus]
MYRTLSIYSFLIAGAIIQGLAMSLFLFPHSIPSGGGAGLALLMNHLLGLPLGFALWVANAVFLLFALQYFGFRWVFRTILAVGITSTTVSLVSNYVPLDRLHLIPDMAAGSILFGIGVGMLIKAGASSGGMVIPALMIANYRSLAPGKVMFWINMFIFLLTSAVINYKIVLYAVICQFLSTNIIDFVNTFRIPRPRFLTANWRKR